MVPRHEGLALALADAHAVFVVHLRTSRAAMEDLAANTPCPMREARALRMLRLLDGSRQALLRAHDHLLAESHGHEPERVKRAAMLKSRVDALVEPLLASLASRRDGRGT